MPDYSTEELYREYHNPSLTRLIRFAGYNYIEYSAEGMYVTDTDGRRWLDFAGGYGMFSMGHKHRRIVSAVRYQLDLMPMSAKVFFNQQLANLAARLKSILPDPLQFSFICNSGTEAVEGALKFARLATGRPEFVTTEGAFHGKTLGALSVSGRDLFRQPFEPLVPIVRRVPYGDVAALRAAVTEQTAAVILEPIQGEGGINIPPDGYLAAARTITQELGALLIIDEVQTGLGRTGKVFGFEHEAIVPDLVVMAKALGGGVMPIGAFTGTPAVWKAIEKNPVVHSSTFGGCPMACAAALAAIDVMQDEKLPERAAQMGALLMERLQAVAVANPNVIASVRGRGLMVGVELTDTGYGGTILQQMAKQHVIAVYTLNQPKVIRFEPPLILAESHIDEAVTAFAQAVQHAEQRLGPDLRKEKVRG